MTKSRIEAFTDAIIAIIMTVIVLGFGIPKGDTLEALLEMKFQLGIYVISFFTLAIYWSNHHHIFQIVDKINGKVMWINNLFLFALSLFPWVTSWLGKYPVSLLSQILYGLVALFSNISFYLIGLSLKEANGKDSKIGKLFTNYKKVYISIGLSLIGLVVGIIIKPIFIIIINSLVILAWLIPEKKAEHIHQE